MKLKKICKNIVVAWCLLPGMAAGMRWIGELIVKLFDIQKSHQRDIFLTLDSQEYSYNKEKGTYIYWDIHYTHEDDTTTQILNALSGFDTDILYPEVWKEIPHYNDPLLYQTIWEMNIKYRNPKIKLTEKFPNSTTLADYSGYFNRIRLQKDTTAWIDSLFNQKYYIEAWIAELSHAYQVKRDGLEEYNAKGLRDDSLIAAQKKTYLDLYDMPWTIEFEAHRIIGKKLKKEFIDTYASLCDNNDVATFYKLLVLNTVFFEDYENLPEALKCFEKILAIDGEIKNERVIHHLDRQYLWITCESERHKTQNKKYLELTKQCYLQWAKTDETRFYEALHGLAMQEWDILNAIKYIQLCYPDLKVTKEDAARSVGADFLFGNKYHEGLQIFEYMAERWDTNAMVCLIHLYDPDPKERHNSLIDRPYKNKEKKEYREKRLSEAKKSAG